MAACGDDSSSDKVVVYTCCKQEDLDKEYKPGETLTLHWVPEEKEGQPGTETMELTALMVGPVGADTASGASMGVRIPAQPVKVSGSPGAPPVSKILIPRDAAPGNYTVSHTRRGGGANVTGDAVIKVVAGG
ncbi:hypothetical protein BG844_33875 [Couchioplanes caeruleus subsp. caeruleus]|uniref:Uncharacterized protein n=1 Tax=Couchioplanes caeruleus subsp. caeruleus TaxID=56427 RepID=A0A1K0FBM5_9ACTN|nr:hypothetical protein BG844_33875 [Couchioplanes caeruleus subsp. caeruleus]